MTLHRQRSPKATSPVPRSAAGAGGAANSPRKPAQPVSGENEDPPEKRTEADCPQNSDDPPFSPWVPAELPELSEKLERARRSVEAWMRRRERLQDGSRFLQSPRIAFEFLVLTGRLYRVRREWLDRDRPPEPVPQQQWSAACSLACRPLSSFSDSAWRRAVLAADASVSGDPDQRDSSQACRSSGLRQSTRLARQLLTLDEFDLVCLQAEQASPAEAASREPGTGEDDTSADVSGELAGRSRLEINRSVDWLLEHAERFRSLTRMATVLTISARADLLDEPRWAATLEKFLAIRDASPE